MALEQPWQWLHAQAARQPQGNQGGMEQDAIQQRRLTPLPAVPGMAWTGKRGLGDSSPGAPGICHGGKEFSLSRTL